eukprot:COSAG05_NODE_2766_length_2670_cov_4.514809_2_plen_171_part_00
MFGDGIYLAEDMGKSDQYCRPLPSPAAATRLLTQAPDPATETLKRALFPGRKGKAAAPRDLGEMRFAFVARTQLGVFVQVGADRQKQLRSNLPVFAAGQRELAMIPDQSKPGHTWSPTHFHSEIAEVDASVCRFFDTHKEKGGNRLRFRELIVFKPTLVYPEYLVAYKRQ